MSDPVGDRPSISAARVGRPIIDLAMPCGDWQGRLPDLESPVEAAVRAAVAEAGFFSGGLGPIWEVSIVLGDDRLVRRLNHERRGDDRATDVLSFPTFDRPALQDAIKAGHPAPLLLGDVVLAYETVATAAAARGLALADHLAHLVVHGMLHLFGYDHRQSAEARAMEALESQALAGLGMADPWSDLGSDTGSGLGPDTKSDKGSGGSDKGSGGSDKGSGAGADFGVDPALIGKA